MYNSKRDNSKINNKVREQPKILIVEDDARLGKTLSDVLKVKGYAPIAVLTGKEGVAAVKEDDISLALLDLKLPDISGIEVLKEIKKISPRTEAIILTAFASIDTAMEAVSQGAFSYLQKPYDMERLLLDIRRALERKWARDELRTLAETYSDICDRSPIAIVNVYKNYRVDCTDRLLEWTGWSREEMKHINLVKESRFVNVFGNEVVLPPLVSAEMMEKTEKEYIPKLIRGETLEGVYQCYNRKDGGTVPLELNSVGYFGGKEPKTENFEYTICIFANITGCKRAEEEVEKSRKFLATIIDNIPDPITIMDPQHRFALVNQAYCDITGHTKGEVIGKTAYWEKDKAVFQTGKGMDISERSYTDLEGTRRYVSVKKAPLTDESGEVSHVVTISRDITERKKADEVRERLLKELEAKNTELERFTYTVSHDLRSPLITIQGFADMLRKDLVRNESEKVESDLKYIENGTKKMELLLSDTLKLSRVGRVAHPPEDVPFGEIAQEALVQTSEQIKKSTGVEVSVAEDSPTVCVDRMRIVEVLVNLIENSINCMGEQPSPKIDIGYRVDGEETVFFVQDNGIGIDKSLHEKVFDLFYKVDKGSKGTGAGLAIVKRIITVHNGRIWIESEKGKGCTVCFTLPPSQG